MDTTKNQIPRDTDIMDNKKMGGVGLNAEMHLLNWTLAQYVPLGKKAFYLSES